MWDMAMQRKTRMATLCKFTVVGEAGWAERAEIRKAETKM